jgi:hypothetical protein
MVPFEILTSPDRITNIRSLAGSARVTALVGSGVSLARPTSLPTGWTFTDALYKMLFNVPRAAAGAHHDPTLRQAFDALPFEILLEQCPCQDRIRAFLRQLYDQGTPNQVHELIAKAVKNGMIHDIITTNYDWAFETALVNSSDRRGERFGPLNRVVGQPGAPPTSPPFYFKIHGSADDRAGETLVFALSQETRLAGAKATLFESLVRDRVLLVLGYSGRDFEICPELVALPLRRILWVTCSRDHLGLGGRRVLAQHGGTLLEGRIEDWLHVLLGDRIEFKVESTEFPSAELAGLFTFEELALWRLAVLNRLSRAADAVVEATAIDTGALTSPGLIAHAHALRADALHQNGKYWQAAEAYRAAIVAGGTDVPSSTRAHYWVGVSDNSRMYGRLLRGQVAAWRARWLARGSPGLAAVVGQTRLLTLALAFRVVDGGSELKWLRRIVQRLAARILKTQTQDLLDAAAYVNYHHLVLWIDRFDVADQVEIPRRRYLDASAAEGFEEVGYPLAQMQAFRTRVERAPGLDWSADTERWSEEAARRGVHAEAYKLLRLRRRTRPADAALAEAEERHFLQCEHRPWMRKVRRRWA